MTERKDDRLWGGRFEREPNAHFDAFQRSFAFDRRLLPYEIAVDRAWAKALEPIGIFTATEVKQTLAALDKISDRAQNRSRVGRFLRRKRRRRPSLRRKSPRRRTRPTRLEAPHRPQPQRTRRHRFSPLRHRRRRRNPARLVRAFEYAAACKPKQKSPCPWLA